MRVYIAGPMRNHPKLNFPAFDAMEQRLLNLGYEVISPAQMDRDVGFDCPDTHILTREELKDIIARDIKAVLECDAICLLKGWETSLGANGELGISNWYENIVLREEDEIPPASFFDNRD